MRLNILPRASIGFLRGLAFLAIPASALWLNSCGHEAAARVVITLSAFIAIIVSRKSCGDEGVFIWKEGLFYRDLDPTRTVKDASDFYPIAVSIAALYHNVGTEERREMAQSIVLSFQSKLPLYHPGRGSLAGFLRSCARNSAIDLYRKSRIPSRCLLTDALHISQGVPFNPACADASDEERLFGPAQIKTVTIDDKSELVEMVSALPHQRQKAIITAAAVREGLLDEEDISGVSVLIDLSGKHERISFTYESKNGLRTESMTPQGLGQRLCPLRKTAAGSELKRLLMERLNRPAAGELENF